MKDMDKKLAEALRVDDEALFGVEADEQSLFANMVDTFRGRRRWFVMMVWFWAFIAAVLMFGGAIMFFRVESESDKLMWALACILGMVANGMLKTWYWMEMNRASVLREIKRVELQIARLAERIPAKPASDD